MSETPAPPPEPTPRGGFLKPLAWAATLVAVVAGSAFAVHRFGGDAMASLAPASPPPLAESAEPAGLTPGHDYYVHLKLVEFRPQGPDDEAWDWGDSGPDPVYRIAWQGNTVHTSSVRGDTLIGSWDLFAADVREVMIDQAGRIDVETLVDAPLIRYAPGGTFKLTVADDEPLGMGETVALESDLVLDNFREGDNAVEFTREEQPLIARLVLTFTDRTAPLPDLFKLLSDR